MGAGNGLTRPLLAGIAGFAGQGEFEFEFAVGAACGYRSWVLQPGADLLTGQTGYRWAPGLNEARCNARITHKPPVEYTLTGKKCGCGFWAYWEHRQFGVRGGTPVSGVIEGTGRALIGEHGFRCQQARIVALHVPMDEILERVLGELGTYYVDRPAVIGSAVLHHSGAETFRAITGSRATNQDMVDRAMPIAERRAADMQVQLMDTYPDAEVFTSLRYMLMKYPPAGRP